MLESPFAVDGTPVERLTDGSEKQVRLVCDECGKVSCTVWHNYIQYQRKNGNTGKTSCQRCAVKRTGMASRGKPNARVVLANKQRVRETHPSWKGGRYVDAHGYVMVNVQSGRNGKSGWSNYRKEHVVLIEQQIGRSLAANEVVHHIDGDKCNNDPLNLWLSTFKQHKDAHQSLQVIGYALVRAGLVGFDQSTGEYKVANLKLRELLEHPGGGNQQPSPDGNDREGSETRERVPLGQ